MTSYPRSGGGGGKKEKILSLFETVCD